MSESWEKIERRQDHPPEGTITCPVCGARTVQEKCKVICRSEVCRGRVIYNCAEF